MLKYFYSFLAATLILLASCNSSQKLTGNIQQPSADIHSIKLLGKYVMQFPKEFQKTAVGGLSSIDYDAANDLYYFVCDDRSDINPARFYSAKIVVKPTGIDTIIFLSTHPLLQPNGKVYPNIKQDKKNVVDPEAMRYNPVTKQLVWSSEGERIVKKTDTVLIDPLIYNMKKNGKFVSAYSLPENLRMQSAPKGPRRNGVLEGLTFADNYKTLFTNVEEPLYEDGPRAELEDNKAFIRLYKFDVNGANTAQYAYKLEPVAFPPSHPDSFKINGVSDILSIGKNKLLMIERSFSVGYKQTTIKLFIADISTATNIIDNPSLQRNTNFVPATKKLLLNMDDLGTYIDNVEGVTFGPRLPNGHQTLVFTVDNNFSAAEEAQLFLFEIE